MDIIGASCFSFGMQQKNWVIENCACIADNKQYVTVIARQDGKMYYCHKLKKDLKLRTFINRKYIVRQSDYLIFISEADMLAQMKLDFAVN